MKQLGGSVASTALFVHRVLTWKRAVKAIQELAKRELVKACGQDIAKRVSLTKELVQYLLEQHHDLDGLTLESLRFESLGTDNIGFLSETYLVKLKYEQRDGIRENRMLIAALEDKENEKPPPPSTLVLKCAGHFDEHFRKLAEETNCYEKEHLFYTKIAPELASDSVDQMHLPLVYRSEFSHHNAKSNDNANYILMQDLRESCSRGNQVCGLDPDRTEELVRSLAFLHASFWEGREGAKKLPNFVVRGDDDTGLLKKVRSYFERYYPKMMASRDFKIFIKDIPEEYVMGAMRQIYSKSNTILEHICYGVPQTLIHADFRADNIMLRREGKGSVVLDWQTYCRGGGVYDFCNIVVSSMTVEDRRKHCTRLLRLYHESLLEHGIQGYTWENIVYDFRAACLLLSMNIMGCISYGLEDNGDAKRDWSAADHFSECLKRMCMSLYDYNCLSLLDTEDFLIHSLAWAT
eukprot:CAMPEP_0198246470 /NCGR_PEP_ID=MMETSP1446-20131203/45987_1 /TAXON_ID=1461542 ORGANISM="Unidentified sp, Strain CCMP2111" /NCGR_SAMPLE_ID=MMETSP1446 /ASSEMBLY_ACC=CAM_ASM_001112 /LENGTH=463 /DNA_ID=CAMNT_0043930791 /DNA_START=885 /DNA_END=2276 /DNA_ORIENTATION=+